MHTALPGPLVETEWLETNLKNPGLRIIDCHYFIVIKEGNVSLWNGKSNWEQAHIPNSIYIDLMTEVSDPTIDLPFMMPTASHFSEVMSQKGIGDDAIVIVYDREKSPWATRLWLMFHENGFSHAAVLNGGWEKWLRENRPTTAEHFSYPPSKFTARPREPSLFTDKKEVLRSIDDRRTILICGLEKESFFRAHIPNSLNIDARTLVDPETNTFLSPDELTRVFETTGAKKKDRIITYCGGGIAGSCVAFALLLLGYENVAVYDGSMEEWVRDPNLPIEKKSPLP